jgi:capsular exopolysaccharide synthesis family protein
MPRRGDSADLVSVLGALRRRLPIILASVIIAAAATAAVSARQAKRYSATTPLLLRVAEPNVDPTADPTSATSPPERDVATNLELLSLDIVRRRTANALLRAGNSEAAGEVHLVKVKPAGESDLVEITAEAGSGAAAAQIANTFAAQYVAFRRGISLERITRTSQLFERRRDGLVADRAAALTRARSGGSLRTRQSAANRALDLRADIRKLNTRIDDLDTLAAVQSGDVRIVDRALPPETPSSPKPRRDALIGGFVGLVVGLALALAREQTDRRLTRPWELEEAFTLPLLASIPRSKALSRKPAVLRNLPLDEAEEFRRLRANLRSLGIGNGIQSLLVTSSDLGEGKTTVALNLAAAAAAADLRVLLIEANLRKPALGQLLGLPEGGGLAALLEDPARDLAEMAHELRVGRRFSEVEPPMTMDVVTAGRPRSQGSEMLESHRMRELIEESSDRYDLIIVDTPAVNRISDALLMTSMVGAALLVARVGRIKSDEAFRLREQLEKVNANPIGVVANFAPRVNTGSSAQPRADVPEPTTAWR